MASVRTGKILFPESMIITPAEDNDLTAFKQSWGDNFFSKVILGDRLILINTALTTKKKKKSRH